MISEIQFAKQIQKNADILEEAAKDLESISEQVNLAALLLESAEKPEDLDLLKRIIVAVSKIFERINE